MWVPTGMATLLRSSPVRVADIGARGGRQLKWAALSDHVSFIGFEPEQAEFERLQATAAQNEIFSNTALFSRKGEVEFHHTRDPATSSIYPPNREAWDRILPGDERLRVVRKETVEVETLDVALQEMGLTGLDFIKLDTQGSELDILKGAEATLAGDVFGIEVEVEFTELYTGQALFPDVHAFLTNHGFEFIDFPRLHSLSDVRWWRTYGQLATPRGRIHRLVGRFAGPRAPWRGAHQVLYADAVFFRHPGDYLAVSQADATRRTIIGAFVSCALQYYEYALDFLDYARQAACLSSEDFLMLHRFVERASASPRNLPNDARRLAGRIDRRRRHPQD